MTEALQGTASKATPTRLLDRVHAGLQPPIAVGLILLAVVGFVLVTVNIWSFTVDDAFIGLRYAKNFSDGWGLSFNHGTPHTEGYTSLLWTLIMAIPHAAGINAVLISKLAGILLTLGTAIVLGTVVYSATGDVPHAGGLLDAVFAPLLFLSFPFCAVHSISGMETALAAFLYCLVAAWFFQLRDRARARWLLPLTCFFLGVTRPEANLFSAILLALSLFSVPKGKRADFIVCCLTCYVLPGAGYFAWRYCYYGLLFPLPFYIKSGQVSLAGLGPSYSFLKDLAVGFTFPLLAFVFYAPARQRTVLLPLAAVFAYLLTVDQLMGFGDRFFYPLLPVLAAMGGVGIARMIAAFSPQARTWIRTAFLSVLAIALVVGFQEGRRSTAEYTTYAQALKGAHCVLGRALAEAAWKSHPVLVIADAGAVPYYSRLETIDSYSLNDAFIATHFRGARGDRSDYILSQNPTLVVFISNHRDTFDSPLPFENELFKSCIDNGYSRRSTFRFCETYYLWAMWRPDSPDAAMLDKLLPRESKPSQDTPGAKAASAKRRSELFDETSSAMTTSLAVNK